MQNNPSRLNFLIVDYVNALASYKCYVESYDDYDDHKEEISLQLWDDIDQAQSAMNEEIERLLNPWQPIETAPKGADSILLGHPDGSVAVAYWGHPFNAMDRDYAWCDESTDYAITWATHWKHVPAAPVAN